MEINTEEFHHLSILDVLLNDENFSQRDIACLTGLNLAKVNFCLKKLAGKGYIKFRNVSKNNNKLRYLYLITPKGLQEKTRLTYNFIKRTLKDYCDIEKKILENISRLEKNGSNKITLLGMGDITRIFCSLAQKNGQIAITAIIDNAYSGEEYNSIRVVSVQEAIKMDIHPIFICDHDQGEQFKQQLSEQQIQETELIWLV